MHSKLKTAAVIALFIVAAAIAIALVSGRLSEQSQRARDREDFPQVGHSVDIGIGGRTLNVDCSGTGQPAVIFARGDPWMFQDMKAVFENGLPPPGYGWVAIQQELAKTTTACWYDRAGSGWSDLGPYPRDSASQARELHALLRAAGVPPPYVLVAESSAALDARVYAGSWPADVAGLVFINGVHPDLMIRTRPGARRQASIPAFVNHSEDAMAQMFNEFGLSQLGLPNQPVVARAPKGITSSQWNTIWHLTQSSKGRSALIQETAAWQRSASEARAAGNLGDRPLIVLSAENTFVASQFPSVWKELQTDLAHLSTLGKQTGVDLTSGDLIYQAPDAIIGATRQVVDEVRRNP
jgi:pimeloyl-ACP methyl ester carboxylesterase